MVEKAGHRLKAATSAVAEGRLGVDWLNANRATSQYVAIQGALY